MGETAENLARDGKITRAVQEEFSMDSHKKTLQAYEDGKFENEIVPVTTHNGTIVEKDEGPRKPDIEKIQSLSPAFLENGTITAATSSPISIGAAAILVTSEKYAKKHKLPVRAEVVSRAVAGVHWTKMGMGPIPATEKVLEKAQLTMKDIETIELNEAFASQSLYVIQKGGWDINKINLNGGAIALGHPLGCSGARIITTLINVMEQQDTHTGLATLCIGGGQGIATVVKRPS
jgi:acetyl-CoA acetyltransferase family protein